MEIQTTYASNSVLSLTFSGLTAGTLTLKDTSNQIVYGPTAATGTDTVVWDTGLGEGLYSASVDLTVGGVTYPNAFGNGGLSLQVLPIPAVPVPTLTLTLPALTQPLPDPSMAAITLTPGTLNPDGSFTAGTTVFGPFAAVLTPQTDGSFVLTDTFQAELSAGAVSVQIGSWPPPQTDPSAFTPLGVAVPGILSGTGASTLVLEAALDALSTDFAGDAAILEIGAAQVVRVRWTLADAAGGAPVTLTGNADVLAMEMAIVHGSPAASDWQPATLLTRTVGDASDGEYTQIKVGVGQALTPTAGTWRVYGRLRTTGELIVKRAPGYLTVRGGSYSSSTGSGGSSGSDSSGGSSNNSSGDDVFDPSGDSPFA